MTTENSQLFHWRYTEFDDQDFQVHGHTLLYVAMLFAVVLLVTLLVLYMRWACRHHFLPLGAAVPRHPLGLHAIDIVKLPIVLHREALSEMEEAGECSICLGAFEDGEKVKVLPRCGHRYHCACVDRWLVARSVCPLCRAPLRVDSPGL